MRARKHVHDAKPRFEVSRARKEELARRFFAAALDGDLDGLLEMLAADAVAYADGGGVDPAAPHPVHGGKKVGNLLMAGARRGRELGVVGMRRVEINGEPGAIFVRGDGEPVGVVALEISDDQVQTIRAISNPEKIRHLRRGPIDVDLAASWERGQDPS